MKEQLLNLTKQLIIFKTVKENNHAIREILDFVSDYLNDFTIIRFEKNSNTSILVHNQGPSFKIQNSPFKIVLNGHLDVVPAEETQFEPVEKDGKLYGRGSYDMKSGCAIIIELFKEYANKVDYPLGLQLVTDEEIGGFDGTLFQLEQGVRADFVIATEPTDYKIKNQAKGVLWVKVSAEGISAHGAYPWKGVNAIQLIREYMNRIESEFPAPKEEAWVTTINPTQIGTDNQASNSSPSNAFVKFDIRYIPEDKERILRILNASLPENCKLEILFNEPVHDTNANNGFVKKLSKIVTDTTGISEPLIKSNGASDLRHYAKYGIDGVEFGPVGGDHHSENEWLEIESLEKTYKILEKFLMIDY